MRCDDYRAGVLAGEDTAEMRAHVDGCSPCTSLTAALKTGHAQLADPSFWEEPSPELEQQVMRLVKPVSKSPPDATRRSPRRLVAAGLIGAAAGLLTFAVVTGLTGGSPDWTVAMSGTELAPAASGDIQGWTEQSGTRLHLDIEGLDPAPDGFVYELWMSDGAAIVSAGTFHDATAVELWAGVSRATFPNMAISLEPLDGDTTPSGQVVLRIVDG